MSAHKFLAFSIVGTLLGGLLALTVPPSALLASEGCSCTQSGSGTFRCKGADVCVPGAYKCDIEFES